MRSSTLISLTMATLASLSTSIPVAVPDAVLADPPVLNARVGKADPPVLNA